MRTLPDKIFTWILGITFLLFVLSGIDIQRRILTPQISSLLHLKWLVIPAIAAFGYHTVYKTWVRIGACDARARLKKALLVVYAAFLVFLMGYFFWYQFLL